MDNRRGQLGRTRREGQVLVTGPGALAFLQKVNANDIARATPGSRILIGLSGRGDKDMPTLSKHIPAPQR